MAISRQQLPKTTDRKQKKVSKVMREFKKGKLNIGKSKKKVSKRMVNGKVGQHIQKNQNYRYSNYRNYYLRNNSIIT